MSKIKLKLEENIELRHSYSQSRFGIVTESRNPKKSFENFKSNLSKSVSFRMNRNTNNIINRNDIRVKNSKMKMTKLPKLKDLFHKNLEKLCFIKEKNFKSGNEKYLKLKKNNTENLKRLTEIKKPFEYCFGNYLERRFKNSKDN